MFSGMQMPQNMNSAQQRTISMHGMQQRPAGPMGGRPSQTAGQMMNSGPVRQQPNVQPQVPAAYRSQARNLPYNVI